MSQRGRPRKSEAICDNKQKILDTAVELIKTYGANYLTVRNVCSSADVATGTFYHYFKNKDDLMMYFVRDISFGDCELTVPVSDIAGRIYELYMNLINRYMMLGIDFMRSFYSIDNHALSAYMSENNGGFSEDTVMARSETEMYAALENGIIKANTDIHAICADICTIVKGCVFEWCLSEGRMDIETTLKRIIKGYLASVTV